VVIRLVLGGVTAWLVSTVQVLVLDPVTGSDATHLGWPQAVVAAGGLSLTIIALVVVPGLAVAEMFGPNLTSRALLCAGVVCLLTAVWVAALSVLGMTVTEFLLGWLSALLFVALPTAASFAVSHLRPWLAIGRRRLRRSVTP